jgi:hypothetical protein
MHSPAALLPKNTVHASDDLATDRFANALILLPSSKISVSLMLMICPSNASSKTCLSTATATVAAEAAAVAAQEKLQHDHHCHPRSLQVTLKYTARHHWRQLGWRQEQLVQQWNPGSTLYGTVRAPAALPWFWGGCLACMDVIAIPSQTLRQAEFERVARVSVSEEKMERSQKAIELFKFILIKRRKSLCEVLYQANNLSQIVIVSAGLSTDLLFVYLLICWSLIFEIFEDQRSKD